MPSFWYARLTQDVSPFVLLFTIVAVAVGLYARMAGLGLAPVGVDEYYLSRGVDGVLKYGLPMFDCGGYYPRGLLLQYPIAGLRLLGAAPELAPRILACFASLLVLPAAFLVGRRFLSLNGALIAVSLIALSLWQVEMGRFGRFYSPFQAVFAWYLVYYLRFVVDRDPRAWKALVLLTLVGAFVWEGAVLLAAANFLPLLFDFAEHGQLRQMRWRVVAVFVTLLVATFLLTELDLRFASEVPPYPDGYTRALVVNPVFKTDLAPLTPAHHLRSPIALLGMALLAGLGIASLRWLRATQQKPMVAVGFLVALAAALLHLFAITFAVLLLLALLRQLNWRSLRQRPPLLFIATLGGAFVFWCAYAFATADWPALRAETGGVAQATVIVLYQLIRFPAVIAEIARPFAATVPVLGFVLLATLVLLLWRQITFVTELRNAERALLVLVVVMLLAIGASGPPRHETRYSVFLYPLMLLLLTAASMHVAGWFGNRQGRALALFLPLALFFVTEDFNPKHLATITEPDTVFKRGMGGWMQGHLGEARDDYRAVANWLESHASPETDVVINGVHGLDYYYPHTKSFFVEYRSSNFADWSCSRGAVDRWTNLPLVYTVDGVRERIAHARRAFLITWTFSAPDLLAALADRKARVVFTEGTTVVIDLSPGE
ncbi:MAG: hypothetical protein ABIT36_09280 [Steroidobacteraceae bacterium]